MGKSFKSDTYLKIMKFKTRDFDARGDNKNLIDAGLASTANSAQTPNSYVNSTLVQGVP